MKSCLGLLFALFLFVAVIGGGAMIWYLSSFAEFSRTASPASAPGRNAPPVAIPVHPAVPPRAKPVR